MNPTENKPTAAESEPAEISKASEIPPGEQEPSVAETEPSATETEPSATEEKPQATESEPSAPDGQSSAPEKEASATEQGPKAEVSPEDSGKAKTPKTDSAAPAEPEKLDPAQEQLLVEKIRERINKLAIALENGSLSEAQSLSDRSHNALSKLSGNIQKELESALSPHKAKLTEMLDWKRFADTEKKKALIEQMQQLIDLDAAPPKKSKQIKALQEEWKTLGHAEDNDRLWTDFSEAARKAFEPCKLYFRERKELMRNNLIERTKICEQLEAYLGTIDDSNIDVREINKLESQARTHWKKYAPVAQNRIKQLQSRFNDVMGALRGKRKATLLESASQKQALIDEAEQLLQHDDLQSAINRAKGMQKEWKAIGPAPFKDERNLWESFRKACDALFARRAKEQPQAPRPKSRAGTSGQRPPATARIDRKQQLLFDAVRAQADFCQEIEESLMDGKADSLDTQALNDTWQALSQPSDKEFQQALQARFDWAISLPDISALTKRAQENESVVRELCVEMEIQAGLPSPDEDRTLRMQQQLRHLKQDFGQGALTGTERATMLNRLKMQFLCTGPLTTATRGQLQPRMEKV